MNTFTNKDSVIDSHDIIGRIEELREHCEDWQTDTPHLTAEDYPQHFPEESEELHILTELAEECEQYSDDWIYGSTLIHRDYFKSYIDVMVADCYELPKDMPFWMSIKLDYDALEQDYTIVDFDGEEYLIR